MTTLDPAYCADGCGRLAETERPRSDGTTEQVCLRCLEASYVQDWLADQRITFDQDMGEL